MQVKFTKEQAQRKLVFSSEHGINGLYQDKIQYY